MKKILLLVSILLFISSCSTYYGNYDYNQYFQNNEPFVTVDSQEEAASFIAKKLARGFRRSPLKTIAILNFTDEYGDRLNRGIFFADMIVSGLSYYRNPIVVERESLYELVKERELSQTNLIANKGTTITMLVEADYILSGRILRGRNDDMISVRCFEVGTGKVVYASTISIDYTPDPIYVPVPVPVPHPPTPNPPTPNPPTPNPTPNPPTPNPKPTPDPTPSDGTEGQGVIDLNNSKDTTSDQYQKKTKPTVTTTTKKSPSSNIKKPTTPTITPKTTTVKKTVTPKTTTIKKSVPATKEIIKEEEPVKEEESTKSTTKKSSSTTKKSSTIKK